MTRWMILLLALFAPGARCCCVWDRDTLNSEVKGLEAVQEVLTGKVERFPAAYYEMRLERMRAAVKRDRFDFPAYDDAAAALDRLSRFDEALDWMEQKRLALQDAVEGNIPESHRFNDKNRLREQLHRKYVNEASFALHRWMAGGAKQERVDDVSAARAMIVQARELNSRFGAERYLLIFIDWIIQGERPEPNRLMPDALNLRFADKTALGDNSTLKDKGLDDCFIALASLIRGSEHWENVDLFYTLSLAFAVDGKQSLAYMARLRAFELIDQGKRSMVPGSPAGEELKKLLIPVRLESGRLLEIKALGDDARREVEEEFKRRRDFSRRWHEARMAHMETNLGLGMHPDLDPRFWSNFQPPTYLPRELPKTEPVPDAPAAASGQEKGPGGSPPAAMPAPAPVAQESVPLGTWMLMLGGGLIFAVLVGAVWFLKKPGREGQP